MSRFAGDDDVPLLHRTLGEISRTRSYTEMRLRFERNILYQRAYVLMLCAIALVYFALIVFRNLAYYRFVQEPGLKDIGYEILPELSLSKAEYVDIPMYAIFVLLGLSMLASFVPPTSEDGGAESIMLRKPTATNGVVRLLFCMSCAHMLRATTYLSTGLPGISPHCRMGAELDPPPTLLACFYRPIPLNGGCGDLQFSGHAVVMIFVTLTIYQYAPGWCDWTWDGYRHRALVGLCLLLTLAQYTLILAARHHYTVDLVIASYIVPLLWSYISRRFMDSEPDLAQIENELVQEKNSHPWLVGLRWGVSLLGVLFTMFVTFVVFKGNWHGILP